MTVPYSLKLDKVSQPIEVDGHGGVDIEYGYMNDLICLDYNEVREMFIHAHAHRAAYQAYTDRDFEDEGQYRRDYEAALKELNSTLDI